MSAEIEQVWAGIDRMASDLRSCWVLPASSRSTASSLKVSCTKCSCGPEGGVHKSSPTLFEVHASVRQVLVGWRNSDLEPRVGWQLALHLGAQALLACGQYQVALLSLLRRRAVECSSTTHGRWIWDGLGRGSGEGVRRGRAQPGNRPPPDPADSTILAG